MRNATAASTNTPRWISAARLTNLSLFCASVSDTPVPLMTALATLILVASAMSCRAVEAIQAASAATAQVLCALRLRNPVGPARAVHCIPFHNHRPSAEIVGGPADSGAPTLSMDISLPSCSGCLCQQHRARVLEITIGCAGEMR